MTRNRVGWVLVDGHDGNGATLDSAEFAVGESRELRAVDAAQRAAEVVLPIWTGMDAAGQRLHAVCVTWSDAAAADAALLLEFLAGAGLDSVVPVRYTTVVETLGSGRHTVPDETALAHGAARTLGDEFAVARPHSQPDRGGVAPQRSRSLTYASAMTTLVAAAVTFVVSLAVAVGLQLAPDNGQTPSASHHPTAEAAGRSR